MEHYNYVNCVIMLDEKEGYFASGSGDSLIKIWKLHEYKSIRTLEGHTNYIICLEVKNIYLVDLLIKISFNGIGIADN